MTFADYALLHEQPGWYWLVAFALGWLFVFLIPALAANLWGLL